MLVLGSGSDRDPERAEIRGDRWLKDGAVFTSRIAAPH